MRSSFAKKLSAILVFVALASLVACGYGVLLNTYVDKNQSSRILTRSRIHIVNNPEAANPLLDKEVSAKIGFLLTSQGHRLADRDEADFFLYFSYGMDSKTETKMRQHFQPGSVVKVTTTDEEGREVTTEVEEPDTWISVPETVTSHRKWLTISLFEADNGNKASMVWRGEAVEEGSQDDLRLALNYLLVADIEEFGKDTGQTKWVTIYYDDARVKSLKGL